MQQLSTKTIWYLSHPVAPDEFFTYDQNLAHVLHMAKLCYEEGFRVYAPWHTLCLIMPDAVPEYRAIGLEVDCDLAAMTGAMILCGHKWSSGMRVEFDAMRHRAEDSIFIDVVGFKDAQVRAILKDTRQLIMRLAGLKA